MKLYEITNDMRELQALVDSEELTPEMIADTMEALDIQFKDKALAALKVRQHLLAEAAEIDKEIARLASLKAVPENNANRITEYIKNNMLALEADKLDLGLFKVTLKKASKKLGQIDEATIPSIYWTIVPETKKLDKRMLLKAAKDSDGLEGVELIDSERALTIK